MENICDKTHIKQDFRIGNISQYRVLKRKWRFRLTIDVAKGY